MKFPVKIKLQEQIRDDRELAKKMMPETIEMGIQASCFQFVQEQELTTDFIPFSPQE
ncbi:MULTISPECIES: hypothetical protein [Pseudanabaena]|jgi:hypothetical protein|uniref:hypothetical protein n=1 Tax=Pseudanabaena TaxID=1152 RepID=UPI002479B1DC|nr:MULTISPECIES: hypothetical protein [Pseudanabaena]MEA5489895.1 hypothetical protein [Pseudanabaena sp. CCNP1317]WGS74496.1 hypothetical protein OA858_10825 [Pseudanabaena galeata CCNP1313]